MEPNYNDVWKVPCPSCGAKANETCRETGNANGATRKTTEFHRARIYAARRVQETNGPA